MSVYPLMNKYQPYQITDNNNNDNNDTDPTDNNNNTDNNTNNNNGTGNGTDVDSLLKNFLQLLVTQMENQDPTQPMDNTQMVTQLAEFNTAAGVEKLNQTTGMVGGIVESLESMNSTNWVGRKVFIKGDASVSPPKGNKEFAFLLSGDAADVKITYTDKDGNTYEKDLHNVKAGIHRYNVDDEQPSPALDNSKAPFKISYTVTGADSDTSTPDITAFKPATVKSVSFGKKGTLLDLGVDGQAKLSDIEIVE